MLVFFWLFWPKFVDVLERNEFFVKSIVFFFWKLSSARDSAPSVVIFLQIHNPLCLDFDMHGSDPLRSIIVL